MLIHKSQKFELDPTNNQKTLFLRYAGAARFAWNWSLARRIARFHSKEGKEKFTNSFEEHKALVKLKQKEFDWMYEVSKCAPQEALRNLDKAFSSFWKRRKEGVGFPKFKSRHKSKKSFSLTDRVTLRERAIRLSKIGKVSIKEKAKGIFPKKIGIATIFEQAGRWFVSFPVEVEIAEPKKPTGGIVGIDLGITTFATLSSENKFEKIEGPNSLKRSLRLLRVRSKAHSRKKKGSKNRKKATRRLANLHYKIANQRRDFLHKLTTRLAKTKPIIVIEDLIVRNMVRNEKLSRRIVDQSWGEFRRQLEYKTKWYSSELVIADRFFPSSKMCSNCFAILLKLPLSVRNWKCPLCDKEHDRDENASKTLELYPAICKKYPKFLGNSTLKVKKPVEISEVNEVRETGTRQFSIRKI